jgi:hypothetical protein
MELGISVGRSYIGEKRITFSAARRGGEPVAEFRDPQPHPSESFPMTRWSLVLEAGDRAGAEAHAALAELCKT